MLKIRFILVTCALMSVIACDTVVACPNCRSAVAQSNHAGAVAFAWSIVLMMLVPVSIMLVWITAFWRLRKVSSANLLE